MLLPGTDFIKVHYGGLIGVLLSCLIFRSIVNHRRRNPGALPHPPGPKGLPIIGSLLHFPLHYAWLVYEEWQKVYGDMIYFEVLGQPFLILGSLRRTTDLFEKRSSICSDRPRLVMVNELMGWFFSFGALPYGSQWRQHRRVFHEFFQQRAVSNYEVILAREAVNLTRRLLDTPDEFVAHILHCFQAMVMDVTYNIQVQETGDPYLERSNEVVEGLVVAGVPGRFLVDLVPVLKYVPGWFPGAGFKRWAAHQYSLIQQVVTLPSQEVERRLAKLDDTSCITATLLKRLPQDDIHKREEDRRIAQNVVAIATLAGADTTFSSIQTFFLAMAMYPDVQKRAQLEIDNVVGSNRLPGFSDRESLPYVDAIVKESLRWFQVAPLGLPHSLAEDMEYDGYFIPKGTFLIGNAWTILHDSEEYPDPEEFCPERFLKDGQPNPDVRQPDCAAFGFGRRVCPGKYFGLNSLYAIAASVLAVYDITPPMDPEGRPVKLTAKCTSGFLSYPVPFSCTIKPRNEAARSLIVDLSESQKI